MNYFLQCTLSGLRLLKRDTYKNSSPEALINEKPSLSLGQKVNIKLSSSFFPLHPHCHLLLPRLCFIRKQVYGEVKISVIRYNTSYDYEWTAWVPCCCFIRRWRGHVILMTGRNAEYEQNGGKEGQMSIKPSPTTTLIHRSYKLLKHIGGGGLESTEKSGRLANPIPCIRVKSSAFKQGNLRYASFSNSTGFYI